TQWHPDEYALADDGEAIWIGAAGGVIRWDKATKSHRRYTTLDGLPHQQVYAVAVDSDGNRWFGGDGGLSRLDNNGQWSHFTTANSALYTDFVDSIATDAHDTLWLSHGLPNGPVSRRSSDGSWQYYPSRSTAVTMGYTDLLSLPQPTSLWTVVGNEVWVDYWVYDGTAWIYRAPPAGTTPKSIVADSQQVVWILDEQQSDTVWAWHDNQWTPHQDLAYTFTTLAVAPNDVLWAGRNDYTIPFGIDFASVGEFFEPESFWPGFGSIPVTALLATDEGVWAVGPAWLRQADGTYVEFPDLPLFADVTDAMLDESELVWVHSQRYSDGCGSTFFQTVDDQQSAALSDDQWTRDLRYSHPTAFERSAAGDLWVTYQSQCRGYMFTLLQHHQGLWLHHTIPGVTFDSQIYVTDIFAQDEQHILLAYITNLSESRAQSSGVLILDTRGTLTDQSDDHWQNLPVDFPGTNGHVAVDTNGRIWYGDSNGLQHYDSAQWHRFIPDSSINHGICDVTPGADGMVFVQTGWLHPGTSGDPCASPSTGILQIAGDDSSTTITLAQLIEEQFATVQTAIRRNRLWHVAPDGAIWYLYHEYLSHSEMPEQLHRRSATDLSVYALPVATSTVKSLTVDSHNRVWMVADHALWRLSLRPDFSLRLPATGWLLTPGQQRVEQLTVERQEGFADPIDLSTHGFPDTITATIRPAADATHPQFTLTISAAPTAPNERYVAMLDATSGTISHTVPLTVTIVSSITEQYLPLVNR
ncbi:MAG: hypothetical protein KDE19_24035, partial [Caldilineaceae bacterium]|nr:hypothetical protein [Caldilineaceae bacterium]